MSGKHIFDSSILQEYSSGISLKGESDPLDA